MRVGALQVLGALGFLGCLGIIGHRNFVSTVDGAGVGDNTRARRWAPQPKVEGMIAVRPALAATSKEVDTEVMRQYDAMSLTELAAPFENKGHKMNKSFIEVRACAVLSELPRERAAFIHMYGVSRGHTPSPCLPSAFMYVIVTTATSQCAQRTHRPVTSTLHVLDSTGGLTCHHMWRTHSSRPWALAMFGGAAGICMKKHAASCRIM